MRKMLTFQSLFLLLLVVACSSHSVSTAQLDSTPATTDTTASATELKPSPIASKGNNFRGKVLIQEDSGTFIANPDGTESNIVVPQNDLLKTASLSNDRTRVAYFINGFIYVKDIQTGGISRLNQDRIGGWDSPFGMSWSPDDKEIAFDCAPETSPMSEICLIDIQNPQLQILTNSKVLVLPNEDSQNGGASFGSWNGDGSQIVFVVRLFAITGGRPQGIIRELNIKTGGVQTIFDERRQDNVSNIKLSNIAAPVLSPDGRTVLFQADSGDQSGIFQINVDETNLKSIVIKSLPFSITNPVWSPKGDVFFASTGREGSPGGYPTLFSLNGDMLEQLDIESGLIRSWVK